MYVDPALTQIPETGQPLSASWCTAVRDALEHVARPPGIVLTGGGFTISNNTWTPVTFNSLARDTDGFRSNWWQLVIPAGLTGWYQVTGRVTWSNITNGTAGVSLGVAVNANRRRLDDKTVSILQPMTLGTLPDLYLEAGDTVELHVQRTGAAQVASSEMSLRMVAVP